MRTRVNGVDMAAEEILRKLTAELDRGITTEVQVVYALVCVRKLMERDDRKQAFPSLTFHCDWAVHAHLDRGGARRILLKFDELRHRFGDRDLPAALEREIGEITQMRGFRKELTDFLALYHLPALRPLGPEGWNRFLDLYARVIADIPLVVKADRADEFRHVQRVVVKLDRDGAEADSLGPPFKVSWQIFDRHNSPGGFYVIHKYDPNSDEPNGAFLEHA